MSETRHIMRNVLIAARLVVVLFVASQLWLADTTGRNQSSWTPPTATAVK